MLKGEGEVRALFADGAAELKAIALLTDGGLGGGEGVAGVFERAAVGEEERAMVGLGSGPGVDLDPAAFEGRLTVLGGELVGG